MKSEVWEKGIEKGKQVDEMRVTRKHTCEQEQNYMWLKLEQSLSNKEQLIKENKTMLQVNKRVLNVNVTQAVGASVSGDEKCSSGIG